MITSYRNTNRVRINDNMITIDARKGEDIVVYLPIVSRTEPIEPIDLRKYDIETFAESAYRERFPSVYCDAVHVPDNDENNILKFTMSGDDTIQYIFETRAYCDIFGVDKVTGQRTVLTYLMVNFRN
ncbi:hypothetical protein [Ralstonia phage RSP15]|uniref:hypothetical protein n=1 Tax=Ralstonia phage RSP15 TaxID=1785960 RepID=UPI00074D4912|nr:hypothetical protein BH754_gp138 [Ralstonia phage RSP15]BAU40168.1 hypothetical protein [Ralstonia phage RSP15]